MKHKNTPKINLTEKDIKRIILELELAHNYFKHYIDSHLAIIGNDIFKLKKHFLPENFQDINIALGDVKSVFQTAYKSLTKEDKKGKENAMAKTK